jgi:hypothetical protein
MTNKEDHEKVDVAFPVIDLSKGFIFFREDIKVPEGVVAIQMSKDMLGICGEVLEQKGLLGEDTMWFWKNTNTPEKGFKKI